MLPHQATRQSCLVLLMASAGLSACVGQAHPEVDIERIGALIERTEAMNNAGDVEGWVALFDDGAVYMPPGQPAVTTQDDLREVAQTGFARWRSQIRITADEIVPSGDWAFARSHVTGTATPLAGGEPVSIDMKQIVLYHRQADGSWKIARLIVNSNGS